MNSLLGEVGRLQAIVNQQTNQLNEAQLQYGRIPYCYFFARFPYSHGRKKCKYAYRCGYVHESAARIAALAAAGHVVACDREINHGFCKHKGFGHI